MAIPTSSTTQIPSCFASVSLGFPTTPLPAKLAAISAAGFQALELGFPDLLSFASAHLGKDVGPYDFDDLCTAGEEVKRLCERFGLKVLVLQPFSNFEGWAEGSEGREDAFRRAKGWVRVMEAVGTDMLQVGGFELYVLCCHAMRFLGGAVAFVIVIINGFVSYVACQTPVRSLLVNQKYPAPVVLSPVFCPCYKCYTKQRSTGEKVT